MEGGSGLPQSSRPSQVSPFVCDFENWARTGRGPRCRMPEQFPTASYSVREAMVATEHFQHRCQEWGRHPEGEAHVGAPSMATAQPSGNELARTPSTSPAGLGPGSPQWGDFVPEWDGTRPSLRNIYNSRNVDGFPAWRECPAALGGWNCLLLVRETTPLDPFLGWKGLIYTQLSES